MMDFKRLWSWTVQKFQSWFDWFLTTRRTITESSHNCDCTDEARTKQNTPDVHPASHEHIQVRRNKKAGITTTESPIAASRSDRYYTSELPGFIQRDVPTDKNKASSSTNENAQSIEHEASCIYAFTDSPANEDEDDFTYEPIGHEIKDGQDDEFLDLSRDEEDEDDEDDEAKAEAEEEEDDGEIEPVIKASKYECVVDGPVREIWLDIDTVKKIDKRLLVEAGFEDANHCPVFVARAKHNGETVPGRLVLSNGSVRCYVMDGGREVPKKNYWALKKPTCCNLNWVRVDGNRRPIQPVIGGKALDSEHLYIGRTKQGRILICRRVSRNGPSFYSVDEVKKTVTFELLTHKH